MEVVCGGGAVGHDVVDVDQLLNGELVSQLREILWVIRGHLEEPGSKVGEFVSITGSSVSPLWSGAAVLGAHPLHAVREQHHQPGLPHPLGLARADKLK